MRGLSVLLASRGRVVLVVITALLVLDLGRSIYARIGYDRPAEPWQQAPYEGLAWPPGIDLPADTSLGERVYVERCAVCHGSEGRGDGPAAPSMIPRPRDFTSGMYKYTTTAPGDPPSDADLIEVVARGLQASAMPYWDDVLRDDEIRAVVDHVKSFSLVFDGQEPEPLDIPPRPVPDEPSLARGSALYEKSCVACHGADGRATATPWDEATDYRVGTRDVSAPWTFRGGSEPEQLWLRLTTGMSGGPMPSYSEALSGEERWDLVNYTLSLARTPPWQPGGVLDGPGHRSDGVKRGEYLVHAEMCGLCHTQVSEHLIYSGDDYYLAGGMGIPVYPHGVFVSRNLTSDVETGLGSWTVEEAADALRNGRAPDRGLNLWGMPWQFLHGFEEEDALAIGAYLKSLPPVKNRIPLPLRYGLVETVVAKALYSQGFPPIGDPRLLVYKQGNYGETDPGLLPRDWPQRLLVGAQWLVLVLGLAAFVLAGPRERRFPRSVGGWLGLAAVALALIVSAAVDWVLYSTPVLPFVPPEQIGGSVLAGIEPVDPSSFTSPEEVALAERGRYLYTVTSCVFCHGNDGSGGNKINMRAFGTVWVRNISSDRRTGLGDWSDEEIARAIRSGVSRDGGVLHWQGMIWDHLSNLDEEDIRAVIAYVRTLEPVIAESPEPVPPSPDDCEEYSFYLVPTDGAGCE